MSVNRSTTYYNEEHYWYKDVYPSNPSKHCEALDCNKEAVYKTLIPTNTYGLIPILVCEECLKLFRSNNNVITFERIR